MQKVNIYIGSAALLWSTERRGNQILIGHKEEDSDYQLDVAFDFIPTSELNELKQAREFWYKSNNNFQKLIDELQPKATAGLNQLNYLKTYDFCYVITAPGGLFSNVATGLLLDFLSRNNIDFRIIVLEPGYKLFQEKRAILINHIRQKHPTILMNTLGFSEEEITFYSQRSISEVYSELTDRMIKYINNATF